MVKNTRKMLTTLIRKSGLFTCYRAQYRIRKEKYILAVALVNNKGRKILSSRDLIIQNSDLITLMLPTFLHKAWQMSK
jgi:hypothetical protein